MANNVDKVIKIAENEVGYLEKSKSAYQKDKNVLYEKTKGAGSDNYTKYGKEMHEIYPNVMDFPAYWCDCFVDWCFYKAYGISNAKALLGGNFDDYTVNSAQLYKNKKAYYKNNPKVGDQIFFTNGTRICHTGLVYKVDSKYVYTIEGNTSSASKLIANGGSVEKKKYSLTSKNIDGYGRPKYDENTNTNNAKTTQKTSFYPMCSKTYTSLVLALNSLGIDSSKSFRTKIANANGISNYVYSAEQNGILLSLLKNGKLIKP